MGASNCLTLTAQQPLTTQPDTTLVPFTTLPACLTSCGVLFDVNGACVPPGAPTAAPEVYDSCFCNDARLTAYSTGTNGPCDAVCAATPDALASLQGWYTGFCANKGAVQTTTTTGGSSTSTSSPNGGSSNKGGGTW